MKCEFLPLFGKIYYKTSSSFIFTIDCLFLNHNFYWRLEFLKWLPGKKLEMRFEKSFHPFCLKVIKMRNIWRSKIARYFIYFGKKIVTYNDDVSMDWCEISLTKNDVPDQIKITD